jgi:hypothetical protein
MVSVSCVCACRSLTLTLHPTFPSIIHPCTRYCACTSTSFVLTTTIQFTSRMAIEQESRPIAVLEALTSVAATRRLAALRMQPH